MKDNKKNIQEELSEISPFLAQLKADEVPIETFNVPDDYFNQLANNIFDKTILQEKTVITSTPQHLNTSIQKNIWSNIGRYFQWLWNPGTAVVLTSTLILVASGFYLMNQESTDYGNDLTAADIEQYIEANIDNFEIEQLSNMLISIENEMTNETITEKPVEIYNIENEDLQKYIEENMMEDLEIDDLM